MFGTTYELTLNKAYVAHWGVLEAVRELIQNALDSDSPFEFTFGRDDEDDSNTLALTSANARLTPQTLLLGSTTKADAPEKIGSFGEGYKIALLVLTREGRSVSIHNGDKVWAPFFRFSKRFDDDLLCVSEESAPFKNTGLTFLVSGLTDEDVVAIRESCLPMQQHIGETLKTSYGDILLQKPGQLFVGGLFICKTELKYGYNMNPDRIKLERDRKTVDNFDLTYATTHMWYETERFDDVAKMIEAEVKDVGCAQWSATPMVKEACFRLFREKNPGKFVATSQSELQSFVKAGLTSYVFVGGSFGEVVCGASSYRNAKPDKARQPRELMEAWFAEARYRMHADAKRSFQALLDAAKGWKA